MAGHQKKIKDVALPMERLTRARGIRKEVLGLDVEDVDRKGGEEAFAGETSYT